MMTAYVRLRPGTGFRIVWTQLKPGARSANQRNMAMTRSEWWRFSRMNRERRWEEEIDNVVYSIEPEPPTESPASFSPKPAFK
jgi:hypothetical protein